MTFADKYPRGVKTTSQRPRHKISALDDREEAYMNGTLKSSGD